MTTTLKLNGRETAFSSDPDTPLLYVLRNEARLNGAKFGCGMGQCGACTVIVDGEPVFSCLAPLAALDGRSVRTVEGLGTAAAPGPLQAAFIRHQAAQCGYCIAGMLMRAQALLDRVPHPTDQQIRDHMEPNLCRCGTHARIFPAISDAAGSRRAAVSGGRQP
jgi:aerobic-type carbon monoxide dehydrogenase small subunit (CoxS/CutS family)